LPTAILPLLDGHFYTGKNTTFPVWVFRVFKKIPIKIPNLEK